MSKESDALLRFGLAAKDLAETLFKPDPPAPAGGSAGVCDHPHEYLIPKIVVNDILMVVKDPVVARTVSGALLDELEMLKSYTVTGG